MVTGMTFQVTVLMEITELFPEKISENATTKLNLPQYEVKLFVIRGRWGTIYC